MSAPTPPTLVARVARGVATLAVLASVAAGGYVTRDRWVPVLFPRTTTPDAEPGGHDEPTLPPEKVLLSEQAQKNLRLTTKPLRPETYWKTITVPGIVVDRPGVGDRSVVAPAAGVVTKIHKVPGDDARPGEPLFTLALLSESLHQTQTELFKATQDIKIATVQREKLVASAGAVPESRVAEVDAQLARLAVAVQAYRQDLKTRGLPAGKIDGVAEGRFVSEMTVAAPAGATPAGGVFEVQELRAELGQLVQAGQTMCLLANHRLLAVEGQAFRDEAPRLERAAREGWPVEVDFGEEPGEWPTHGQTFKVNYVGGTIDPDTRTFRFLLPLDNESRPAAAGGHEAWRFRPGQRVRLGVRVEKLDDVFVLPAAAVAREGADAFVFRQNGDTFERRPVHVLYLDRATVVVANDGSVPPGLFVAQTGAAQIQRMLKAGTGGLPPGTHMHADGSLHKNH